MRVRGLRRLLRYSLRTLLVAFTIAAIWLGVVSHRARTQERAVRELRAAGASVYYDFQRNQEGEYVLMATPPGPEWLREWLGIDYLARVRRVEYHRSKTHNQAVIESLSKLRDLRELDMSGCEVGPRDFVPLSRLSALESLELGSTRIDDDSLGFLSSMPRLETLYAEETAISGKGLRHLHPDAKLKVLYLRHCPLSSEAYEHIGKLESLEQLDLDYTTTTDVELARLRNLRGLSYLALENARVSDEGLRALNEMKRLEVLCLNGTMVNGRGLKYLGAVESLQQLRLDNTLLDDVGLEQLERFRAISRLDIRGNRITIEGLKHLARMPPVQYPTFDLPIGTYGEYQAARDRIANFLARESAAPQESAQAAQAMAEWVGMIQAWLDNGLLFQSPGMSDREIFLRLAARLRDRPQEETNAVAILLMNAFFSFDDSGLSYFHHKGSVDVSRRLSTEFQPITLSRQLSTGTFQAGEQTYRALGNYCLAAQHNRHNLTPAIFDWPQPFYFVSAREELTRFARARIHGLAHDAFLLDLIERDDEGIRFAVLNLVVDPSPVAWLDLAEHFHENIGLLTETIANWRRSDPSNAAPWYVYPVTPNIDHPLRNGFKLPRRLPREAGPPECIQEGNTRPEVRMQPVPPWLDDQLLARAEAILKEEGLKLVGVRKTVGWMNPWQWQAPWREADAMMDALMSRIQPESRDDLAETMAKRFIVAQPRELATVLHGCWMLGDWCSGEYIAPKYFFRDRWMPRQPRWEVLRRQLRRTACNRLAETLSILARDGDGQRPVDKAMMTAWMAGLASCSADPVAALMNEAIEAWTRLDERLASASFEELGEVYKEFWGAAFPVDSTGEPDVDLTERYEDFEDLSRLFGELDRFE